MRSPNAAVLAAAFLGILAVRTALASPETDVAAARVVFERNLRAIEHRDAESYLDCYLPSPSLTRTGPDGFVQGFDSLAASTRRGGGWPDHFEALALRFAPVRDGVVYATYRYRVRYGADEQSGLSERVFVATERGWKIAVTTAFPAPAGTAPPARALVGATLVDGTGAPPVRDAVVLIRDGRIDAAGPRARVRILRPFATRSS